MTRVLVLCLLVAFTVVFALLNWTAFAAPTTLSLGFTSVQAPLGLIMLVLLGAVCIAFTAWAISLQGHALMDARRLTKDLQTQRDLADKAEASRFTELRAHLDAALAEQRRTVEQQANSLAASLAELEDRLERRQMLAPVQPVQPVNVVPNASVAARVGGVR
jgi:uncharacterized protein YlxW (UPF0749 family)